MPARAGSEVMAPGDREYRRERERLRSGIPIEAGLAAQIRDWSQRLDIAPPRVLATS